MLTTLHIKNFALIQRFAVVVCAVGGIMTLFFILKFVEIEKFMEICCNDFAVFVVCLPAGRQAPCYVLCAP